MSTRLSLLGLGVSVCENEMISDSSGTGSGNTARHHGTAKVYGPPSNSVSVEVSYQKGFVCTLHTTFEISGSTIPFPAYHILKRCGGSEFDSSILYQMMANQMYLLLHNILSSVSFIHN